MQFILIFSAGYFYVCFSLCSGALAKINKIRVDWEYPPFEYAVLSNTFLFLCIFGLGIP